jgi:hypothetical protein
MSGPTATPLPAATRSLRRARMLAQLPRLLALTVGAVLILTGLRALILPPAQSASDHVRRAAQVDLAALGFAEEVARRYLTFDADPDRRARELAELTAGGPDDDLGLTPGGRVAERVHWVRAVQDQAAIAGGRLVTVAAMTDRNGLLHLSVPVRRDGQRRLTLAGYPALVGAPSVARADPTTRRNVSDPDLRRIAVRAVTNYLAGDGEDLAADLAPAARVTLPALALIVEETTAVTDAGAGGVLVTVRAHDRDGTRWTLSYELGVARRERWYVTAVHSFPDQP